MQNHRIPNTLYYGHMGHGGRRFGAGAFFIRSRESPYYNGRICLLCSSDKVYKKLEKKQNHRILYSTATWDSVPVAPVAAACLRNLMVNGFDICS